MRRAARASGDEIRAAEGPEGDVGASERTAAPLGRLRRAAPLRPRVRIEEKGRRRRKRDGEARAGRRREGRGRGRGAGVGVSRVSVRAAGGRGARRFRIRGFLFGGKTDGLWRGRRGSPVGTRGCAHRRRRREVRHPRARQGDRGQRVATENRDVFPRRRLSRGQGAGQRGPGRRPHQDWSVAGDVRGVHRAGQRRRAAL